MDYKSLIIVCLLALLTSANRCINTHCSKQEAECKNDTASLPCHNIVNTCLDYCSNNQSYACLSLCVSGRKNEAATKFVGCCAEFTCKVQKFTAWQWGSTNLVEETIANQ